MDTNNRTGKIITFYSYKGGTGRSMALANIACLMAREKLRVLVIDWDLEAPGLHRFFPEKANRLDAVNPPGIIDLFSEFQQISKTDLALCERLSAENGWRELGKYLRLKDYINSAVQPGIDLIKAGRLDEEYPAKVARFDWNLFFQECAWSLQAFGDWIANHYDYCLIDSRTGITDISGICTSLLPEKLVLVFTPNKQSLYGVLDVSEQAVKYRRASNDLRPLSIFPLPSRVDDAEKKLGEQWRKEYQTSFEQLFVKCYELGNCDLSDYFDNVKLPHKSYYSYGEKIAVTDERDESLSLHRAYRHFYKQLVGSEQIWPEPSYDTIAFSMLKDGQMLENKGDLLGAVALYRQSLFHFEKQMNQAKQIIALNKLGNVLKQLGNTDEAISLLEQSLTLSRKIDNQTNEAMTIKSLGEAYQAKGEIDKAIDVYQRGLKFLEKSNNEHGTAIVLNSLGSIWLRRGNLSEAAKSLQESYSIFERLNDQQGMAATLHSLGRAFQLQGQDDKAIVTFERSRMIFEKCNDLHGSAVVLNSLGRAFQQRGKLEKAVVAFKESIDISKKLDDKDLLAFSMSNLATTQHQQLKLDEAVNTFQRAIEVNSRVGYLFTGLGNVFYDQKNYEKAIACYQQALQLEPASINSYIGLGHAYTDIERYESALAAFQKAIELDPRLPEVWYEIGNIYMKLNKREGATLAYQRSLEIFSETGNEQKRNILLQKLEEIKETKD